MEAHIMGEAKRTKSFKYLPNSPDNTSFPMDIIKITRSEFIRKLGPNETAFMEKSKADGKFAEIMYQCIELTKQMRDPSLPTKLCLFCDYEYDRNTPPEMIIILRPHTDQAHTNTVNVLCPSCARHNIDVINTKTIEVYQKTFGGNFSVSWNPQCDF
jgi:hypothetical protein